MARKERYLIGLDVGTSKVTAVVGEMLDGNGLDIVGLGVAESRGIRRGVVVNLEAAVDSIKKAIEEAELMAGVENDSVHLALSAEELLDLGNGVTFSVIHNRGRPVGSTAEAQQRLAWVATWQEYKITRVEIYVDIDEARAAAERLAEERG